MRRWGCKGSAVEEGVIGPLELVLECAAGKQCSSHPIWTSAHTPMPQIRNTASRHCHCPTKTHGAFEKVIQQYLNKAVT